MSLVADVTLSDERLQSPSTWEVEVTVRNDGADPVTISTAALAGPIAFEVVDAQGERVALGPPPMPPADLGEFMETVEPGGVLSLRFPGHEILPDPPPSGRYKLRFVGHAVPVEGAWAGIIESPWVTFVT